MNKLLSIIFVSLLLSGNGYAEIIGKSTVTNVDRCIKNSTKLLFGFIAIPNDDINQTKCIVKFQKKIKQNITSRSKGDHGQQQDAIIFNIDIKNSSSDVVITGFKVNYKYSGTYDGNYGTVTIPMTANGDAELDESESGGNDLWLRPGESTNYIYYIQWYSKCPPGTISKDGEFCSQDEMIENYSFPEEAKVTFKNKDFKYEVNKLEKGSWHWTIQEVYGVFID